MKIGGLQKISLIDYPKELSAIIFTIGCNFRCPYCHNPDLVIGSANIISADMIFDFLKSRIGKLSAVSITGGEPTLHSDLPIFIKETKNMGYKVKLDTNGTNPDMLEQVINDKIIDYVAMDVKAPLHNKYNTVAGVGVNVANIVESINIIKEASINYEFRTTTVKSQLTKDDIFSIAELIKGARLYYLQRFRPFKTLSPSFMNEKTYTYEELEEVAKIIRKDYSCSCYVR